MIEVSPDMKKILAQLIIDNIKENFKVKHITLNLVNTIQIQFNEDGNFIIDIPAEIYDLKLWNEKKAIVYTGTGSYANLVNKKGGFSGTHKNYVETAIDKAISQWLQMMKANIEEEFYWKVKKE